MENLDKVWDLIKIFAKPYLYITDYRDYLIKKISEKYTPEEFYKYECIINNLFWDLKEKLGTKKCCNSIHYYNNQDLDKKLDIIIFSIGTYYRSFINKLIIIDRNKKKIYYKKMEGSSEIFKEKSNTLAFTILFNRELYYKVMNDQIDVKKINLPEYYFQGDYGFPNLNCCKRDIGTKEEKMDRINKMYYNGDSRYWYKLI